ncbi:transcription factor bHLH95-like [Solanum lycopersicum]|uniref:BHLH domain-containing protein n=1 Tax=Solanum lycopersicum TaxID=4081 RepID=K4AUZ9_SOLLC|nr:transcription factor bHLH95-like [Solanum lycopersicum]
MNEDGENNHDHLCDDIWSYLDWNDHQVESGETEGNKLLDPTGSDTCEPFTVINEVVEVSVNVAKKRSSANRKKNGKEIAEPNSGVYGAEVRKTSKHEVRKWTERERRKKMRTQFENLHALVPNLPAKADMSKIVYEAVNRIRKLKNTFKKLESQKLKSLEEYNIRLTGSQKVDNSWEKYVGDQGSTCNSIAIIPTNHGASPLIPTSFMTWSSPNVILNVSGEDAHISVCCPKKPRLFTTICYVLEKHKIDIVSSQISSDQFRSMFMIQAHAKDGSGVAQFSEAFTVEDMYKQAANEIMLMTTPK